ncbi:isochorismate synthase [Ignavibacterium sp.]|uniref:isochorismate synthase n=1 Tax=Ignavibacterium sp. TaxID=2651167 RepID=UPI00307D6ECC
MNNPEQNILVDLTKENLTFHQFVFPIEGKSAADLIDAFKRNSDLIIYQSKPSESTEYLAIGKLFQFELDDKNISTLDDMILNFRNNVSAGETIENIPLFFGYSKFPSLTKEKTWKNFTENFWIIPQYLIFKSKTFHGKEEKLYCVQNFLSSMPNDEMKKIAFAESQKFIKKIVNDTLLLKKENVSIVKTSDNDSSVWKQKVSDAIEEIKENKLQKIVLARKVEYEISGTVIWSDIFEKLNSDYPDCFNFLVKSGGDYFFGSSPELLGKFEIDIFKTEALAGSINRGSDENEDSDLALLLSASRKNKKEHDIVIDHLIDNLNNHLFNIEIDETPLIKRLKNIQHLQTKISGKLKDNLKYFNVINSIFPTPAICGIPTRQTLNNLKTLEAFDRGLYSGIVGAFNLSGEAEFYVAIRSALISDNKLTAFAGCGIVEESNPDEEYTETELKLQPIISLFSNEN